MSKERYRHYLIVRRHDGVRVGFLCPNGDLEQWKAGIEWGTVEASFRIAFIDDSEDNRCGVRRVGSSTRNSTSSRRAPRREVTIFSMPSNR